MQIPILNGIYTDDDSDYRIRYPRNLVPVPLKQGISNGYLRPSDGIIDVPPSVPGIPTVPGISRGGINWDGLLYRVMGTKLVSITEAGAITEIGDVGGTTQVSLDYSFDYLSVSSNGNMYLYDGAVLTQITDIDLGTSLDHIWIDGYFMSTDGEFVVVTELTNPFSVNPTKYGSSEVDPDPIVALLKLHNEPYLLNRYTIEVLENIGGSGFPFQTIQGAQLQRGTVGTHACCTLYENIYFVGSGRNESPSVWVGGKGRTERVATREVDQILEEYTETELSQVVMEPRVDKGHRQIYIHLLDKTIVYDLAASMALQKQVWFILSSTQQGEGLYYAKDLVWIYNKWYVGHPLQAQHGYLTESSGEHWGNEIGWEFSTQILYNESNGAIFHELELIGLPGRAITGEDPMVGTQYSFDGIDFSPLVEIPVGTHGQTQKRIVWLEQGSMRNFRIQRFHGSSDARLSIARLDARIEALAT